MLQGQDVFNDPPPRLPPLQPERRHTLGFQTPGHTYMLPIAHYLNLPLHLPLTLSARPPHSDTLLPHHLSATALQPSACSLPSSRSCSLPAGQLTVDVKVGSVVSNSPSDTGLLTFHCTLRKEGFLFPPQRRHSSSAVTAPGAFWGLSLALAWEEAMGRGWWWWWWWRGGGCLCCHGVECQA